MIIVPLGKIVSVTPGTPVRVTATPTPCYGIVVVPLTGNAGNTYFGVATLVKATGVGVIKTFTKPATTGVNDTLIVTAPEGNLMNAADYYVDADTAGDGFLFSYVQM
jgi:hypothetical protein